MLVGSSPGCGLQLQFSSDVLACAESFVPPLLHELDQLLVLPWREQVFPTIFSIPAPTIFIFGGGDASCPSIVHPVHSIPDSMVTVWLLALDVLDYLLDLLPLHLLLLPHVLFMSSYQLALSKQAK